MAMNGSKLQRTNYCRVHYFSDDEDDVDDDDDDDEVAAVFEKVLWTMAI